MIAILDQTLPSTVNGAPSVWIGVAPAILYVDDDEIIREICREILMRAGYSVDLAGGDQAGWESLHRKNYHLLIAEHDMSQPTGLELAVRVRGAGMELPIIIASGFVSFTDDDAYAWLRFSACLRKPFTPATLLRAVEDVLHADPLLAKSSA